MERLPVAAASSDRSDLEVLSRPAAKAPPPPREARPLRPRLGRTSPPALRPCSGRPETARPHAAATLRSAR
eukprot:6214508-Pleurochrysis_carterae.AAC.2